MKNIKELLSQVYSDVSALRKAQDRFAEQLAPEFRIFDYLRTDEYGLSRCLADLLNPKGKHGQGRLFLNMFLERINAMDWAGVDQCKEVKREKPIKNNRKIDIYLEFKNGAIGIENKPWADDQDRQLYSYAEWLKKHDNKWILVFISNREPHEKSITKTELNEIKGHFIRLSYHNMIEWLEMCAAKAKALTVRIFIEELMKFIRTHVNREIEMNEVQQITESVLEKKENFQAAWDVRYSFDNILTSLNEKFERDIIEKTKEKKYIIKEENKGFFEGKAYCDLGILIDNDQNVYLVFGFNEKFREFYWGMAKNSKTNIAEDKMKKIQAIMESNFGPNDEHGEKYFQSYPWYTHVSDFRDWNKSEIYWAKRHDELAKKIVKIAVDVYEKFKNDMDLLMPEATPESE